MSTDPDISGGGKESDDVPAALKAGLRNFIKNKRSTGESSSAPAEAAVSGLLKQAIASKGESSAVEQKLGLGFLKRAVKKAAIGKLRYKLSPEPATTSVDFSIEYDIKYPMYLISCAEWRVFLPIS
jgi:hypothetical protein